MEAILLEVIKELLGLLFGAVFKKYMTHAFRKAKALYKKRFKASEGDKRQIVTIFAEAEYDPATGLTGWAAWYRTGKTMMQQRGMLDAGLISSQRHAELTALQAGIDAATKLVGVDEGDLLVVQSSGQDAIAVLAGRQSLHLAERDERQILRDLNSLLSQKGLTLKAKHLSDPGGNPEKRAKASRLCKEAAAEMLAKAMGLPALPAPEPALPAPVSE